MIRHSWEQVKEDLRLSVLDARPKLDRCKVCGVFRCHYWGSDRTYYWFKELKRWTHRRPECTEASK
jgi:hypothetical protein